MNRSLPSIISQATVLITFATSATSLCAQTSWISPWKKESFDQLWGAAMLYHNDQNPILEEFKLRGRYHGQYHHVEADGGDASGWEDRRARLGFDAKLFDRKIEARVDFQSNNEFDNIYDGLTDAYLRWKPNTSWSITAGKLQPLLAYGEWGISSNDMPTFERSQIFNQLNINRATGLTMEGTTGDFLWQAGVYANDTPSNTGGSGRWGDGEWGSLSGGCSTSIGFGYNMSKVLGFEQSLVRIDWLHSNREKGDLVLARYDDIVSTTFTLKDGPWGFTVEGYYATGGDGLNEDVFGVYLQPTYDLIPKTLQLVGRYTFTTGEGSASVVAQSRYERETQISAIPGIAGSTARGDEYHAIYLGAQYFIYGNKLKLMAGAEWSQLLRDGNPTGYEGVTALTGIRLSF